MKFSLLSIVSVGFSIAACSGTDPATGGMGGTSSLAGNTGAGTAAGGVSGSAGSAGALAGVGGNGGAPGGGSGGAAGGSGGAGGVLNTMPTKLSETGLFTDMKAQTLAPGVYAFEPAYKLWSDGATKKRWVYMPPGGKITTDNMDYWEYPAGFKLWKEFSRDGKLIETRLLLKKSGGITDWYMVAFKWNDDHSDALALPDGEMNAMGTMHDIPNKDACTGCHGAMNDYALGFTALQLSHSIPGSLTLAQTTQMGWFTTPPAAPPMLPGTDVEKAALGYLHANCGMCHNDHSTVYKTKSSLDLWTHLDKADAVQKMPAYLSLACDQWPALMGTKPTQCDAGHATGAPMNTDISKAKRVVPGDPAMSGIHDLMALRATGDTQRQMPPLGTEIVDTTGMAAVDAWITGLPH